MIVGPMTFRKCILLDDSDGIIKYYIRSVANASCTIGIAEPIKLDIEAYIDDYTPRTIESRPITDDVSVEEFLAMIGETK